MLRGWLGIGSGWPRRRRASSRGWKRSGLGGGWALLLVLAIGPAGAETVDGERLFGYAGIENERQLREVSAFSNIVLLDPLSPSFTTLSRLARARGIRVALAWDDVLFDTSRLPYRLRANHRARLEAVVAAAPRHYRDLVFHQPVDEPYWHGVPETELDQALALLKEHFPGVPTLIVLAWPTVETRLEPVPSDWVAFDRYFVPDPAADPDYQQLWNRMRSLNPGKPIVVVADGFYSPAHAAAGIAPEQMGAVLRSYQALFDGEPRAVALGVFRWSDGLDVLGTRSLPAPVVREHAAVGGEVTGRCGVPESAEPLAGETVLWFRDCRFYARVGIDDPRTAVREGHGVALSDESGAFWFFNDRNLEISIKVLDGTGFNGHFWVFLSDTTDVNYQLEVHDTWTGTVWRHANLGGELSVRRDVNAFRAEEE